jgi:PAS domain S-box-containing protein
VFRCDYRTAALFDGTPRWVRAQGRAFFEGGAPVRFIGTAQDTTQQRRAEETAARLAAVAAASGEALIGFTPDGAITTWNPAAEQVFGYSAAEALGRNISMLVPPGREEESAELEQVVGQGLIARAVETQRRCRDGRIVDVSLTLAPVRDAEGRIVAISGAARDNSERRRTEAELARYRAHLEDLVAQRTAELDQSHRLLRRSERLAAVGTLAAGIGHDLANLLLPIRARVESLRRLQLAVAARGDLEAVDAAMDHLQRLSAGMRLLALDPALEAASAHVESLHEWWQEAEGVLRSSLPRHVRIEAAILPGTPGVRMPRHRLTQVVFNLVQNAGEAMARQAEGVVRIAAAPATDGRILLTVGDTGPGMSPQVLERCFEPYFSTKGRVIATGMGLSLVRGLVEAAGGSILVRSEEGHGATFDILLPEAAAQQRAAGPLIAVALPEGASGEVGRAAALVTMVLRGLGAQVARAASAAEIPPAAVGLVAGREAAGQAGALAKLNPRLMIALLVDATRYDEPQERAGTELGGPRVDMAAGRIIYLGGRPTAGGLRDALAGMMRVLTEAGGPREAAGVRDSTREKTP